MSKFVILGDTHFGCSSSSEINHRYMKKFYADFFKYIDANSIRTILQLGDLFDVRKHINTWSLNFFRENFLKPVIERNLNVIVLLGNHDIYYRESLQISSVEEVLSVYSDWFTLIKEPTDMFIESESFLLVPWVCKENNQQVQESIKNSISDYCAGHFEFNGFELFKGQPAKTHYDHQEYQKFKKVFSGHYHHMSSKDNVLYTGTPYELTWQDCGTSKGFFVFNDGELIRVENQHTLYSSFSLSDYTIIPEEVIREKHVKIRIDSTLDQKARDALLDRLYSMSPHSLKLIEPKIDVDSVTGKVTYTSSTSIGELITDYVANIEVTDNIDRDKLNSILIGMFAEASSQV